MHCRSICHHSGPDQCPSTHTKQAITLCKTAALKVSVNKSQFLVGHKSAICALPNIKPLLLLSSFFSPCFSWLLIIAFWTVMLPLHSVHSGRQMRHQQQQQKKWWTHVEEHWGEKRESKKSNLKIRSNGHTRAFSVSAAYPQPRSFRPAKCVIGEYANDLGEEHTTHTQFASVTQYLKALRAINYHIGCLAFAEQVKCSLCVLPTHTFDLYFQSADPAS